MVNIRKLLTEVLLTVTNEEMKKIAQETYNEALRGTLLVMLVGVIWQVSFGHTCLCNYILTFQTFL